MHARRPSGVVLSLGLILAVTSCSSVTAATVGHTPAASTVQGGTLTSCARARSAHGTRNGSTSELTWPLPGAYSNAP